MASWLAASTYWRRYNGGLRLRATLSRDIRDMLSIKLSVDNPLNFQRDSRTTSPLFRPDNHSVFASSFYDIAGGWRLIRLVRWIHGADLCNRDELKCDAAGEDLVPPEDDGQATVQERIQLMPSQSSQWSADGPVGLLPTAINNALVAISAATSIPAKERRAPEILVKRIVGQVRGEHADQEHQPDRELLRENNQSLSRA